MDPARLSFLKIEITAHQDSAWWLILLLAREQTDEKGWEQTRLLGRRVDLLGPG